MTVERWSVHRYRAPRLDVRRIERADDAVAVDSKGNLYVGDIKGQRVQRFVPSSE